MLKRVDLSGNAPIIDTSKQERPTNQEIEMNEVTLTKATNVLFTGMLTKEQGWQLKMVSDGSRFGFYKTKKQAITDAARYSLKIV
jgi:hypothetical protein